MEPEAKSEVQEVGVFGGDRVGRVSLQVEPGPQSTSDPSDLQGHSRPATARKRLYLGLPEL